MFKLFGKRKPTSLFADAQTNYLTRTSRALEEVLPKIDFEIRKASITGRNFVLLDYCRMTDIEPTNEILMAIEGYYSDQGFRIKYDKFGSTATLKVNW